MNSLPFRLRFSFFASFTTILLTLSSITTFAQDNNRPPKNFTALFNGHDFDNWVGGIGDDDWRKVEAMSPEDRATRQKRLDAGIRQHWSVQDGVLVSDGNPHFFLATPKDYGDIEMWVDWKINKKGDSGIYLRGVPQVQIWDPHNPEVAKLGIPKAPAHCGTIRSTKNGQKSLPTIPSASGIACTSAWSDRTSR